MADGGENAHEAALDRTAYWTLSLYIDSHRVFGPAPSPDSREPSPLFAGRPYDPTRFARLQARSPVSRALRDSIEPLFNDIADREWLEGTHDFLFAADEASLPGNAGRKEARARARKAETVVFQAPGEVTWTTEGIRFVSCPQGLDRPRPARLRRFWFVQNNGAITYNLSFAVGYEHKPADYYFLSLLQKIAAPKEFALDDTARAGDALASPLDEAPLGIAPLDSVTLDSGGEVSSFWRFVERRFDRDAAGFFDRVAVALDASDFDGSGATLKRLVPLTPIVEVPGLALPKNRYMFMINDQRFFGRLIPPLDGATGLRYPRKMMVQDDCFRPYADELKRFIDAADEEVRLEDTGKPGDFWEWVRTRPDDPDYLTMTDAEFAAIRVGTEIDGQRYHIPAIERGRADCIDYLFLSGFNQNIIDFMNQDTSEILDSLDPIYPKRDEQMDERFFVRFANHRGMITYVPRSRSLEVGNDYIGTCPYAFLIHAHAMHNEFLARRQEKRSFEALNRIEAELDALHGGRSGAQPPARSLSAIGLDINSLKMGFSRDYERYRHVNAFRYDTERDVFEELEKLRGTERKQQALQRAITDLEDHARDLDREHERAENDRQETRDRTLSLLLGALGLFGALGVLFQVGDYLQRGGAALPAPLDRLSPAAISNTATLVSLALLAVFASVLLVFALRWVRRRL